MERRPIVLVAVAALAVVALAAGAANVQRVDGGATGPPAEATITPPDRDRGPSRPPVRTPPESTAAAACPNCPEAGWPGLLGLLGAVPGGPLAATLAVLGLAALLSWGVLSGDAGTGEAGAGDDPDRTAAVPDRGPGDIPDVASVPPRNEVFRAWRSLRERVADRTGADVAPLTPREVAAAARRHGLADDAVGELTGLFERVRYGDRPASDERERRAAEARGRLGGGEESGEASTGLPDPGGETMGGGGR